MHETKQFPNSQKYFVWGKYFKIEAKFRCLDETTWTSKELHGFFFFLCVKNYSGFSQNVKFYRGCPE